MEAFVNKLDIPRHLVKKPNCFCTSLSMERMDTECLFYLVFGGWVSLARDSLGLAPAWALAAVLTAALCHLSVGIGARVQFR